jgi:hypothetical protein
MRARRSSSMPGMGYRVLSGERSTGPASNVVAHRRPQDKQRNANRLKNFPGSTMVVRSDSHAGQRGFATPEPIAPPLFV